jgi:hypothetical protein
MYPIRCHSDSKWPFKVVSIGEINAEDMTHVEAQNQIRAATDSLSLSLSR